MKRVRVIQVRSKIGRMKKHCSTLESLGLRKIGQSREHNLTPQIQGMIDQVHYLIKVEELS